MDIWEAAAGGHLGRVSVLVQQSAALVHGQNGLRETPLFSAARGGHSGVLRYLLNAGADINHRDCIGWTALHWACMMGHAGGADVTFAVTDAGFTALTIAASNGRDAVVRLLLEHGGSDVNAASNYGETALHGACAGGYDGVVKQLLEAGADPTQRTALGQTAVDYAANRGRQLCLVVLQEWDRAHVLHRSRRLCDT